MGGGGPVAGAAAGPLAGLPVACRRVAPSPDEILAGLLAGNERFAAGDGAARVPRPDLAGSQSPGAVVVACADSRVAPEIIFDQGLGDLFVVRAAGNTVTTPLLLGSVEYGVEVVGAVLVLVVGHEGCRAVAAALEPPAGEAGNEAGAPGQLAAVLAPLLPAVAAAGDGPSDARHQRAVTENVRRQVALLRSSAPVLAPAVAEGRVGVAGACYSLRTGRVALVTTAGP